MRAAGHDEKFVHVGRAGDDRFRPANDHAILPALLDVHIDVAVLLLAGPERAVALRVCHGDAEREVLALDLMEIVQKALAVVRCIRIVGATGRLINAVQRIVREIALRAARRLADEAHGFEFGEKIGGVLADMNHAIDGLARCRLRRRHQLSMRLDMREVVGDADARDARREQRLVGDAVDLPSFDEDARAICPQRFPIIGGVHQHGVFLSASCRSSC